MRQFSSMLDLTFQTITPTPPFLRVLNTKIASVLPGEVSSGGKQAVQVPTGIKSPRAPNGHIFEVGHFKVMIGQTFFMRGNMDYMAFGACPCFK